MKRLALVALALAACGHDGHENPPPEKSAELGGTLVARVGGDAIPASLVASVAKAQGIEPRAAMQALVQDALAAEGARGAGYADDPDVRWAIVSARARLVAERLRKDALAKGAPTDAEVDELTARHWRQVDAPEAVRVIHAVVLYPRTRSPENDQRAHAVYDQLVAAEEGAKDADDFAARASAVPHDKVRVTVERLSALARDGRAVEGEGAYDPGFSAAAFGIDKPGRTARVETSYGWHLIMLVDRVPAHTVPFEERRAMFAEEAQARRAHTAYEALLQELRARHPVEVSTAAESLMSSVVVAAP